MSGFEPIYAALGKEVLHRSGEHIADAANTEVAEKIAHALNLRAMLLTPPVSTPSTEGQGA